MQSSSTVTRNSIRLDHNEVKRKKVVKKKLSARNCSNIKTAASNLDNLLLNVFRFTSVINPILRFIFVYSFTLNFLILLFPTFCNKLILSPVYSFFPTFCNKWILSLTIFCFQVLGLFRTFHTHTTMLNAHSTIFCSGVLGFFRTFHTPRWSTPTPRFFISEFWVSCRVLVLFGLISSGVLRKN